MRLMTGVAGCAPGVLGGSDLREALWFGRVLLVAAAAESGDIRQLRFERRRVVGMPGLGPVTGLAGDVGVPACGADFGLILVAEYAGFLAGKRDRPLADHLQGARAVVTVLPECLGDDCMAHQQKDPERCEENDRRSQQMGGISNQPAQVHPLLGVGWAKSKAEAKRGASAKYRSSLPDC